MDHARLTLHRLGNRLQTLALLAVLALVLGALAWVIGGASMLWGTLLGLLVVALTDPVGSPRLLMSLYGARPVAPDEAPELAGVLALLTQRAGLTRVPQLYYLASPVVNAFTAGRREAAAILVSDGLLRRLDWPELAAVLAHEVAHIAHDDLRVMTVADLACRLTRVLSLAGQLVLLLSLPALLLGVWALPWVPLLVLLAAPSLSALVQLALSRQREYEADRGAVSLTGDPGALVAALVKLDASGRPVWEQILMPGRRLPDPSLLRTHPPTGERVRRLLALAPAPVAAPLPVSCASPVHWVGGAPRQAPHWRLTGLWH